MAVTTFSELPVAATLSGGELVCISVYTGNPQAPYTSETTTVQKISSFYIDPLAGAPSMRQLCSAMAQQGVLWQVYSALPSDITNTYNIAWYHAFRMPYTDAFVSGFLQPTLGYTQDQMQALFALALTFPL